MKKKNINKIIKYERKPIQISNSLQPPDENISKSRKPKVQEIVNQKLEISVPKDHPQFREQKLQIPKGWRVRQAIQKIRNRLIATVESKQSIISITCIFQNEQLNNILGKKDKCMRQSMEKLHHRRDTKIRKVQPMKQVQNENYLQSCVLESQSSFLLFQQQKLPPQIIVNPNISYKIRQNQYSRNQCVQNYMGDIVIPGSNDQFQQQKFQKYEQSPNYLEIITQDQSQIPNKQFNLFSPEYRYRQRDNQEQKKIIWNNFSPIQQETLDYSNIKIPNKNSQMFL